MSGPGEPGAPTHERPRKAYRIAALFVLPYLILMVAWAGSNPPGAAPDEADHLIKAMGVGRLHIGETFTGTLPANARLVAQRNASISRVVTIPGRLAPDGYKCTAFRPEQTANCLPQGRPAVSGDVERVTPVGSYPPFVYLPIGLAADATSSPSGAFLAGRLACVAMAGILLFLGAAHLVGWLGRRALLGAFVGLTPMALFASAMVSTSGVEICAAFAVACVGVVAIRRRESLLVPSTQYSLAVGGAALALSRQLGSVTLAAIIVLVALRVGRRDCWQLLRRHQVSFVVSAAVLAGCVALTAWWEHTYDHPALTGGIFDVTALHWFDAAAFHILREGVGDFGWLDTTMPLWMTQVWIVVGVALLAPALLLGGNGDRFSLIGWLCALAVVAYVAYATVFFPIRAGLQARHLLPFFMMAPLLAGVVFVDTVGRRAPAVARAMFALVGVVMPVLQLVALFLNARRYAVGEHGPLNFLSTAAWHPTLGWPVWLGLSAFGALSLGYVTIVSGSGKDTRSERRLVHVEG